MLEALDDFGAPLASGDVFYDLGSGFGKAVLQAYLVSEGLATCKGIELLIDRWRIAEDKRRQLLADLAAMDHVPSERGQLEFILGDFSASEQWADATVVFMNSVCYDQSL